MADWVPIDKWPECRVLERPGIIFELVNAEGLSLFSNCGPLPPLPFGWKSPPIRFRAITEPAPVHSNPLPRPSPR